MCDDRKYPGIAKIGSITPLKKANQKDFLVFLMHEYIGSAVASPSGKFWMAIPMANIKEVKTPEFAAIAVPIANPTESPSGILCIVMAEKSLKARDSSVLLFRAIILEEKKSRITIKNAPIKKPNTTGRNERLPQSFLENSNEGTRRDQNDAESIIPEANPMVSRFKSLDSFLKKKIKSAPSVVARHGSVRDSVIMTAWFILCKHPFSITI